MNRKMTRSAMLIITYTVLLILLVAKFDVVWGGVQQLISAMSPLFLGFAIAFVLSRPCRWLNTQYGGVIGDRAARPLAVATCYVGVIAAIVALFSFVLPQVGESISLFAGRLNGYMENLQLMSNRLLEYFHAEGLLAAIDFSGLDTYLKQFFDGLLGVVGGTMGGLVAVTGSLMSMVITLVLSVVFSIYMLANRESLLGQCRRVLYAYVPEPWAGRLHRVTCLTAATFNNFVSGQLLEACILGGLCAAGMLFIQSDYAALIGVIVGISALVPVAGAYIGALVSAFLLVMVSPVRAAVFLVFLLVLQQIEGNVIYPRVVGTSIGLPGLWVLAAVTIGGGLFGLLGVMLSVPLCSVVYTLVRQDVRRRTPREREEQ